MGVDVPVLHTDGSFINERVSRVAEIIKDYDPRLDVRWVPPDKRLPGEPAFAIVETPANGPAAIVFYVKNESEMDERVIARIFAGDTAKNDILTNLDAHNAAAKAMQMKQQMEEIEDEMDFAKFRLNSPLNTIHHNGKKYRDNGDGPMLPPERIR